MALEQIQPVSIKNPSALYVFLFIILSVSFPDTGRAVLSVTETQSGNLYDADHLGSRGMDGHVYTSSGQYLGKEMRNGQFYRALAGDKGRIDKSGEIYSASGAYKGVLHAFILEKFLLIMGLLLLKW